MEFSHLGLYKSLLQTVAQKGYTTPTPVQQKSIPPILQGRDVVAAAQTGTGKTAAFVLPIIQKLSKGPKVQNNSTLALILAPTRELAIQIDENIKSYAAQVPTSSKAVFGGVKINPQMMGLRAGVDILVATPGRLLDLYRSNAIKFEQLQVLVLDEADRMLDLGFAAEINEILQIIPQKRQTLLFSATIDQAVRDLADRLVNDPVEIYLSPEKIKAETVNHVVYPSGIKQKPRLLAHLIIDNRWDQVLVFCKTRRNAQRLTAQLEEDAISAVTIHGKKHQSARIAALEKFKDGEVQVLVATDLVARGLDIDQLPYVVNFDLPKKPEDYVHRIGRTGRAGLKGEAISLVSADDFQNLVNIELFLNELIPRIIEPGFEPVNKVPESSLSHKSTIKKPKRPKKAIRLKMKAEADKTSRFSDAASIDSELEKNTTNVDEENTEVENNQASNNGSTDNFWATHLKKKK